MPFYLIATREDEHGKQVFARGQTGKPFEGFRTEAEAHKLARRLGYHTFIVGEFDNWTEAENYALEVEKNLRKNA